MDILKLACLLASYEMDEPHTGPHAKGEQHYPEFTEEQFRQWLSEPHQGDCTGLPAPCNRCYAEEAWHKAKWIGKRLA